MCVMKNDRACTLLMIMWFRHPANTTISGWQQSKICILPLYLDFKGLHQAAQCQRGNEWLLYVSAP